ncbi:MAG: T9SS type A sorting domain-containing protein [Aquaticitalea sp.]
MEAYMQEKMQDPQFVREHLSNQIKFREELAKIDENRSFARRGNPIIIPVALHFVNGSEANRDCLEELAQSQVDILNADYAGTNSDFSLWGPASAFYPGVSTGATDIYFCIATLNHPINTDPQLVEGGPAVTIGYNFGNGTNKDMKWAGYINFVIKDISDLGFSPLGGSVTNGQAVTIDNNAFGTGAGCPGAVPESPYNLGRTLTHELGHFLNLRHTFGNGDGCGTDDDGIADTPKVGLPTYGCPAIGSVDGCVAGEKALTMDYMDYVNDACMYIFTKGQATVIEAYVNVLKAQFKPNVTQCVFGPDFTISAIDTPQTACASTGSVTYNFNFNAQNGYNQATVFAASGKPANSTVTFSPSSRSTSGPFSMTIGNLAAVANGNYNISLTASSSSLTKAKSVYLTLGNDHCTSVANIEYDTSTTGVIFNSISNLNNGKPSGYSDFTNLTSNVNRGENYILTVQVNTDGPYSVQTKVWIDWNQNCRYDDAGEEYILGNADDVPNGNTSASPLTINIPVGATLGSTIMRVVTKYVASEDPDLPSPCLDGYDGETEDYTIKVLTQLGIDDIGVGNFSIFPNPNNGQFTISMNSPLSEKLMVKVFDIRGRKIYDGQFENATNFIQTINLNNVQSGMYLVKLSDGKSQATKRVIVD